MVSGHSTNRTPVFTVRLMTHGCCAFTVAAFAFLLALPTTISAAQRLSVMIIDRQNNSGSYTYVVPGYSTTTSTAHVGCSGGEQFASCSGSSNTTAVNSPPMVRSYRVHGATLSLQLPDGRIAVVNCESKADWGMSGIAQPWRSCRIPLVDDIQADFDGDKAKLRWVVSIDGKKTESETYKILGVLNRH